MSRIVMAFPTLSDAATVTDSNGNATYPIANALKQQPRETVRTADNTDSYYTVDLGAAKSINCIMLLYTNADSATNWRIRAATTEAGLTASPVGYDTGTLQHWPPSATSPVDNSSWTRTHALHLPATAQSFRWWRIDVTGLSGLSYYEFGRLYVSTAYKPTRNADIGLKIQYNDSSDGVDTPGAHYRRVGKQWRTVVARFSFRFESEAYDDWLALDRAIGGGGDLVVITNPADRVMDRMIYGYLDSIDALDHGVWNVANASNLHTKQYTITEFELP